MKNELCVSPSEAVAEVMRPVAVGSPPAVTYPRAGGPWPRGGDGPCPFCGERHGLATPMTEPFDVHPPGLDDRLGATVKITPGEYAARRRRLLHVLAYTAPELVEVRLCLHPGTYAAWIEHSMRRIEECEGVVFV